MDGLPDRPANLDGIDVARDGSLVKRVPADAQRHAEVGPQGHGRLGPDVLQNLLISIVFFALIPLLLVSGPQ